MRFDHVGVATRETEELTRLYEDVLETTVVHQETKDDLKITFLDMGNGYIEFLEPIEDEGTIAQYLDDHGPGIQHLAVVTEDIHAALEGARSAGVDLIDDEPRQGAWGHDIAFLDPASTGGILLEFVEH